MTVAVVIPYFQKTEGLLANALRSIIDQKDCAPPVVVVVDDSSPLPAESEVAKLGGAAARLDIRVIRQPNAGPAAARNRGLDALGPDIARVAFLDSDDVWTESHLAHATLALDAGHEFFFADLYQPGQTVGGFARAGRIVPDRHPSIGSSAVLHSYAGDMFDQIVRGNVIGTSTVVYDFDRFRSQRFDEAFYSAGEDYLFWIALARGGARFAFSSEVEAHYGYGVNVYAGSGWGTPGYMRRIQNEMRYRKRLLDFDLTGQQRAFVLERVRALRVEFASDVVHRVLHRQKVDLDLLRTQLGLDALTLLALPYNAGQLVARQIKGSRASR
jgi:succinoglycan biosynthesis protein ExoW